jgi:hypothetical protein
MNYIVEYRGQSGIRVVPRKTALQMIKNWYSDKDAERQMRRLTNGTVDSVVTPVTVVRRIDSPIRRPHDWRIGDWYVYDVPGMTQQTSLKK